MSRRVLPLILLCTIATVMAALLWPRPGPAAASEGVAAIATGGFYSCALTTAGGVQCWGYNGHGQLGDGTTTDRMTPVNVVALTTGVISIAAGGDHTCALTTAGGVKCWGWNIDGELGDGTTTDRTTPVDVVGLSTGAVAVIAEGSHTCALTTAGGVKCWGQNFSGALGDGTTTNRTTPVDVVGLTNGVTAIGGAGDGHTCALTATGGAKCWGWNRDGQLGDGTTTDRTTPVDVVGLTSGVTLLTAGNIHSCALTVAGGVKCWGYNSDGELGDGTTTPRTTPVDVVGLSGMIALGAGGDHTCAVTGAGGLKCWGWNFAGQLGDGTSTSRATPVDVVGLKSDVAAVDGGGYHTCALTTAGGVKCWGQNFSGALGDGTTTDRITPVDVIGLGPKPTPTPPSVGGASLDAQFRGSSRGGAGLLAGAVGAMAAAVALGGGVWYARRRRSL